MRILNDDEKQLIIKMYLCGETQRDIAKCIKCRETTITKFLRENGYQRRKRNGNHLSAESLKASRKHHFNERFFQSIDSEAKAYWLGFLFADGNVYINKGKYGGSKGGTVELSLKIDDVDHIKNFLKDLQADSDYPIDKRTIKLDGKIYYSSRVAFNSIDMCHDLIQHGCVPHKSLILNPPTTIPTILLPHFIRGYFDGDGTVSFNEETKKFSVCLLGTKNFLEFVKDCSGVSDVSVSINGHNGNAYNVSFSSISNTLIFYKYAYNNSTRYLKRKYDKYTQLYLYLKDTHYDLYLDTQSNDPLIKHKSYGIPVVRIDNTFKDIKIYKSGAEACRDLFNINKSSSGISMCCRHKAKTAFGYYWLFYRDYVQHKDNLEQYIKENK